ncbi:MAG: beta-N-acetylhexosaminidase [Betaproteobacteria bacterium RIFCSPLOWO2_12_FULL_62_58]|nr:MAG: beta-N-acetylhexosaminidase [Betaproteobacteria bacterium RIFCSPLOWO2_02_FULL_62_79]OGA48501.1 MAG: beta-N-acetylhexosaminidase [Betaproteobacteria bacterium RIFCSPLOWO2_12_FULL_62_58]
MALGPVVLDVAGTELTPDDRRRLLHPLTGGVILFSRNYATPEQLLRLTAEIHALRSPALIIAVDHEGGRVQRFRQGFTAIPAMRELGKVWDANPQEAKHLAHEVGFVLAAELRAHGVDLSFAPVLDVDHGNSSVIGDRALHSDPQVVAELARALVQGLRQGGMSAVGKHYPGHGYVRADSHHEIPVDDRSYAEIELSDLMPFRRLIGAGLGGIMPAHVIYPQVDYSPAGFSSIWLKKILRTELTFDGIVFSDDLSMAAASVAGGVVERARTALSAGCDMVLTCNNPAAADELLAGFNFSIPAVSLARLARMHGRAHAESMVKLREDAHYVDALRSIAGLGLKSGDLPLA